ncbi:MAG: tRNA lysidine(34) synthetase [Mycobacteriales bacterium]|nr:tRNA lysidine(34) synthetase [Mycobacteriales bacterium]
MPGPPPATAAVRLAVRRCLADLPPDALVAAAVSGGADSLALAAALAFERPGAVALVVDHGLQDGSAEVAARAADQCRALGLTAEVLPAPPATSAHPDAPPTVTERTLRLAAEEAAATSAHPDPDRTASERTLREGGRGGGGPEGRARDSRYAALGTATDRLGAAAVLLGHTLDDQAETVLLGLARGAGARSLAGMPAARGLLRRPLLGVTRAQTRQACVEAGLTPWDDPHNGEPAFARVRVRATVLPVLEEQLGPGVAQALVRSARQLREDADALDALADEVLAGPQADTLAVLGALAPAVLSRVLKRWGESRSGRALSAAHVDGLRSLVEDWHGQGPVDLPGGGRVTRQEGRLAFEA